MMHFLYTMGGHAVYSAQVVYSVAAPAATRATNAVAARTTDALTPVANAVTSRANQVAAWAQPLPPPPAGYETVWKYRNYPLFIAKSDPKAEEKRLTQLFDFFKKPENLQTLAQDPNYVLCALHNPGVGLDLLVLHNISGPYDSYLINHYEDWFGASRDRLYETVCMAIKMDPRYEDLTREALKDRKKLLYKVLEDHRYIVSPQAITTHKPDTITRLNEMLREREKSRIPSSFFTGN